MKHLLPAIGAKGLYRLRAPYDRLLTVGVDYTCVAIRKLSDFDMNREDPKAQYYDPYFDDTLVWDTDSLDAQTCIVSLVSDTNQFVYVPSNYILAYPNINGIPYTVKVVGANLGPLPDEMDLTILFNRIKDVIRDTIGIQTEVLPVVISEMSLVSKEQHDTLLAARQALINETTTERARILELENQLVQLKEHNSALTTYIQTELGSLPG